MRGTISAILGLAVSASGAAGLAPFTTATVEVNPGECAVAPDVARLVATAVAGPSRGQAVPIDVGVTPGEGHTRMLLPMGFVWRIELKAPGCWSAPQQLMADGERAELRINAFRSAAARMRLTVGGQGLPDATLHGRVSSAPGGTSRISEAIACPLTRGVVECTVPAVRLDLALKVPGHAGIYLWDQEFQPGQTTELGDFAPPRGASVTGFVAVSDARVSGQSVAIGDTSIRAEPEQIEPGLTPERLKERTAATRVRANARGFFQLVALPAGPYRLLAEHPVHGRAEQGGLRLQDEEVTIGRPLALAKPTDLVVRANPPRSPSGAPWTLVVARADAPGSQKSVFSGPIPDGSTIIRDLVGGQYRGRLGREGGDWFGWQEFELPGRASVDFDLDLVDVEGYVALGDEPLPAALWFGTMSGGQRIKMQTAEDGSFSGVLPREGLWTVDVASESAGVQRRLRSVEVHRTHGGGPARVEIVLPDTTVVGRVTDPEGRAPMHAGVAVNAPNEGTAFMVRPAEDGSFVLRGLGEALLLLSADGMMTNGTPGKAAPVEVRVDEDGSIPDQVELVLRPPGILRGQVVDIGGRPVAGALVLGVSTRDDRPANPGFASTTSGRDGRFELSLGGGLGERAMVYWGYAGSGLRGQVFSLGSPQDFLTLVAEAGSGDLTIRAPSGETFDDPLTSMPAIFQDDVFLPPAVYYVWLQGNMQPMPTGAEVRIGGLAPGRYTVCKLSSSERLQIEQRPGAFRPGPDCASGYLVPGGVLEMAP